MYALTLQSCSKATHAFIEFAITQLMMVITISQALFASGVQTEDVACEVEAHGKW
jgi:hypothetical protein